MEPGRVYTFLSRPFSDIMVRILSNWSRFGVRRFSDSAKKLRHSKYEEKSKIFLVFSALIPGIQATRSKELGSMVLWHALKSERKWERSKVSMKK